MKTTRHRSFRPAPSRLPVGVALAVATKRSGVVGKGRERAELRVRLAAAEETLRAIRAGEVDTVVVAGKQGPQVFTLQGAEHAYRVLIESMNEGFQLPTSPARDVEPEHGELTGHSDNWSK